MVYTSGFGSSGFIPLDIHPILSSGFDSSGIVLLCLFGVTVTVVLATLIQVFSCCLSYDRHYLTFWFFFLTALPDQPFFFSHSLPLQMQCMPHLLLLLTNYYFILLLLTTTSTYYYLLHYYYYYYCSFYYYYYYYVYLIFMVFSSRSL